MYRKLEFLYMLHPICIKITDIVFDGHADGHLALAGDT